MDTILPYNGIMNQDTSPLYIDSQRGEVIERRNARVISQESGQTHINASIRGTASKGQFGSLFRSYIAVGSVEDIKRNGFILFLKGNVSGVTDKIVLVVQNSLYGVYYTDLIESSALNFHLSYPVDADIIDDFLIFTDNYNPPRKINIVSPVVPDEYNIQLAVRPPSSSPVISFISDTTRKINHLIGKSFQFAYQYMYRDNEYSTVSPYSDIAVAPSIFAETNNTFTDNNIGNGIIVRYDVGSDDVVKIRLLAREGNTGDWFIVDEYDKDGEDAYTARELTFYDNTARKGISRREALTLYSDVPLLAKSVVTVQNRVALANVLKGYDKTDVNAVYSVGYGNVAISAGAEPLTFTAEQDSMNFYIAIDIPAVVAAGSTISLNINFTVVQYQGNWEGAELGLDYEIDYSFSYTVEDGDTRADVLNAIVSDITQKGNSLLTDNVGLRSLIVSGALDVNGHDAALVVAGGYDSSWYAAPQFEEIAGSYVMNLYDVVGSYDDEPEGQQTYKSGAHYMVGVVLYDEFGRTSGVLSPKKIYIPSNGERTYADAYKQAQIRFNLAGVTFPSWAKYMRFAISEAVDVLSVYPFVSGSVTDGNIRALYLDNKPVLAINIPTNVGYEFNPGDYLLLESDSGSAITSIVKTVMGTRSEILFLNEYIAGYWLIVPRGDEDGGDYEGRLAYIVRPKKELSETIYYEDSVTYPITNGSIAVTEGTVGQGDAWFVTRSYQWDDTVPEVVKVVEDFFVSVDNSMRAYSKGRPLVELEGQVRLQDFVWSNQYIDGTKINGLSFFESGNRVHLDEKHGEIVKTLLVGDVVKVIQLSKETSLYIGKQQVTNADGSLQLIASGGFVGTVYPSMDDTGSRHPKSVVQHNRNLYYWDGRKGEVIRSAPNGSFPISSYNMRSYFQTMKARLDSAASSDVIFHFDRKYKELYVTFSWHERTSVPYRTVPKTETVVFSEDLTGWTYFYDLKTSYNTGYFPVDIYENIGNTTYAFNFGTLYEFDSGAYNTFFGVLQPLSVKSSVNISPVVEKCLRSVKTDSNMAFYTDIESEVTNTRPVGQKSVLYPLSYREREGNYVSPVYRNILKAGGVEDLNLLYEGDRIVGKHIEVTFRIETSNEAILRMVTFGLTVMN